MVVNANGFRIEVEYKGHNCSAMPMIEIDELVEKKLGKEAVKNGLKGKSLDPKPVEELCDALNQMVREGKIILIGSSWLPERRQGRSSDRRAKVTQCGMTRFEKVLVLEQLQNQGVIRELPPVLSNLGMGYWRYEVLKPAELPDSLKDEFARLGELRL